MNLETPGLAQYNVTFKKLYEYLDENNIELPEEETEFDSYESSVRFIVSYARWT